MPSTQWREIEALGLPFLVLIESEGMSSDVIYSGLDRASVVKPSILICRYLLWLWSRCCCLLGSGAGAGGWAACACGVIDLN